jgi:hypothetical protein
MKTSTTFITLLLLALSSITSTQVIRVPLKTQATSSSSQKTTNFLAKNASIAIQNYLDMNYIGAIQVGSSKQQFNLVLDTGSANLWIPDSSLATVYNSFDCSRSQTCKPAVHEGYSIKYGLGQILGYKITDEINLGDLPVSDFPMLLAIQTQSLTLSNYDGILGLALGRYIPSFPTLLESLKKNNLISTGTFSMYLGADSYSSGGKTGELIFGGYDPKYAQSEFQFVKVKTEAETIFWEADMSALGYGNTSNLSSVTKSPVIFDSGTSLLVLPEKYIVDFVREAGKQGIECEKTGIKGMYACDCSAQDRMADMVFYFDDVSLSIPPSSYMFSQMGYCFLAIQPQEKVISVNNPIILGDVFLKNFYTLYTADNYTVGFAKAAPVAKFPAWIVVLIMFALVGIILGIAYVWNKRQERRYNVADGGNYTNWNNMRGVAIGQADPARY